MAGKKSFEELMRERKRFEELMRERKRDEARGMLRDIETTGPGHDKPRKGYFHCWEDMKNEDGSQTYAIIEFENGEVGRVDPNSIKFIS